MFITHSKKAHPPAIQRAEAIADRYQLDFYPRTKLAITKMMTQLKDDAFVVGNDFNELYLQEEATKALRFHPSFGKLRIYHLNHTGYDPLIDVCNLQAGDTFLDCTMGLAADSLVASYTVGPSGHVQAVEGSFPIYLLVSLGLKQYAEDDTLIEAMRRIDCIHSDYLTHLKGLADKSFDVVYFDPMFTEAIETSTAIRDLDQATLKDDLPLEAIQEARRVAKRRVVLKDHFRSQRFETLGFTRIIRPSSRVHYGYIDV
ncbi:hypothetical protein CL176_11220 [Suicoccus acidiformans]|uniref:SAM-dependent methyltransferase n=1 Tax=Suicoccus acidiformans TaxID=2036206 RepID=A0A347WN63_9LACT|nr:class I SAM-dependent methyltransferase [Suicoccus acidiformans]AXY26520.1 hypothetical protein CL176_11220 [Suicoccus acidiformans]